MADSYNALVQVPKARNSCVFEFQLNWLMRSVFHICEIVHAHVRLVEILHLLATRYYTVEAETTLNLPYSQCQPSCF